MSREFEVLICEETGMPCVRVPGEAMWDLLEYLSQQRVRTTYDFETAHCTVFFPYMDRDTSQKLMDEWARSQSLKPAGAIPQANALFA